MWRVRCLNKSVTSILTVRRLQTNYYNCAKRQYNTGSWTLGKINHVAIAVPDLQVATSLYRDTLKATVSDTVPLPEHGVYTVFVELGDTKIELLHPLGENSPIEGFLKRNPSGGIHHICLEVDDIKEAMKSLEGTVRALSSEPKIGAHGKPVVFLHPKDCSGVLIELEQK